MSWITDAFNTVTSWVNDNVVKPTYNVIVKPTYNKAYDLASSDEVKSVLDIAEKAGIQVEDCFVSGANSVYSGLGDTIKEKVSEGWKISTEYISENACQLGVSKLVSGAVALVLAEKELDFRYKAVEIFVQTISSGPDYKKRAIAEMSKDVSNILSEVVHGVVPIGSKEETKNVIGFLVFKSLMDDSANLQSLQNLFSGALVTGITSYICNGSMPEGYSDWKNGIY